MQKPPLRQVTVSWSLSKLFHRANRLPSARAYLYYTPPGRFYGLRRAVEMRTENMLQRVRGIVYEEEMTDREKIAWLQEYLE